MSKSPHHTPLSADQQRCLAHLRQDLQTLIDDAPDGLPTPEVPDALLEAIVRRTMVHARPPLAWLADCGFVPRPIDEFPAGEEGDAALQRELWRVLYTVGLLGFFFDCTDHLDDRTLYRYLLEKALQEPTAFAPGNRERQAYFHDLAMDNEGGPVEDARIQLTYYRDRSPWKEMVEEQIAYLQMEGESVPEPRPRPADRDQYLP